MGDAAHAMVPFYGQGMNAVSIIILSYNNLVIKEHVVIFGRKNL